MLFRTIYGNTEQRYQGGANKMIMFVYYGPENLNQGVFIVAVEKFVEFAANLVKFSVFFFCFVCQPSDLTVGKGFD
jgi:hypothetical protein